MNIAIGSAFRNSSGNVKHYMAQVANLRDALKPWASLRVLAIEGDSTDNTREALERGGRDHCLDVEVTVCNHGGPVFGSVETKERMVALSKVGNAIFDAVRSFDDVLLYVESDLYWKPETMIRLVRACAGRLNGFDIFSPMVMAGDAFYDIWGFRGLDGRRFSPFPGYYPGLDGQPFEVGSVGSCLAVPTQAATKCRIKDDNCLVGWCADARAQGYRIAVLPDVVVRQV